MFLLLIHYYGKVDPGSGSTFPKCGSQDPDPYPRQNEMDPKRCFKVNRGFKNIKFNVGIPQESFSATLWIEDKRKRPPTKFSVSSPPWYGISGGQRTGSSYASAEQYRKFYGVVTDPITFGSEWKDQHGC